jgi:hypothetical protein
LEDLANFALFTGVAVGGLSYRLLAGSVIAGLAVVEIDKGAVV